MTTEMNKLPIIESPKYHLTVPSTGKIIEFRPFTVREEKMMMIAQESNDQKQIFTAARDIIKACTFGRISVNALTMYDFEYIFIQLRCKSVGETTTIGLDCDECNETNEITINLSEYKVVQKKQQIDPNYKVNDQVGIVLKPITMKDAYASLLSDGNIDAIVSSTIKSIYDDDNVYDLENYSQEAIMEFIDSLPHGTLEYIQTYIQSLPKVEADIQFECTKCKHINKLENDGIINFF